MPAGSYNISIKLANAAAPCTGATAIGPAAFNLMAGKTNTIVAHLTAAGAPSATMFENNTGRLSYGMTRISLAHAAFAPAVDAKINRLFGSTVTVPNVTNGQQAALDTRIGIYGVSVNLAGTNTRVFRPCLSVGFPAALNLRLCGWICRQRLVPGEIQHPDCASPHTQVRNVQIERAGTAPPLSFTDTGKDCLGNPRGRLKYNQNSPIIFCYNRAL